VPGTRQIVGLPRASLYGAIIAAAIACTVSAATASPAPSAEQRARELVARMTLEEKASQLINSSPAIPRLGIPDYQWWTEALHGLGFVPSATNFPEPIGLAAAFDAPLLRQIAQAISAEGIEASDAMVAAGDALQLGSGRSFWSPNINIVRDPRWGRGQETYGEDPFLTATMGVAYVTGIQGLDPAAPRNIATPKHFAVHSGPESTRHTADVKISLHDLRDTYLPAFRAAMVDGHAGSIMCSYNSINGQPACANDFLLRDTLRRDWGFKGVLVSDCGAVRDISSAHKYAANDVAGAALAVHNGLDVECATESIFDRNSFGQSRNYMEAVNSGKLQLAELDQAVVRGLAFRIRTGSMDRGRLPAVRQSNINSAAHRALALTAAEKSLVLLKNDGLLPLRDGRLKIAVVGPLADSRRVLRGNYTARDTSELPSVFDGIRRAFPTASVSLVPAGESFTDGDVVPSSVLQTEDGKPGVTVRYYPLASDGKPAPQGLMEKFMRAMQAKAADMPVASRVEPLIDYEVFTQPLLPDGGQAVASGYLVPKVSGTYRLGVRTLAGSFQFGDKAPMNVSGGFNPTILPTMQTVDLEAGKRYPFTVTMRVPALHFAELDWQRISTKPEAELVAAAKDAEVIVAVVGLNSTLESEESSVDLPGFKGGDRTSLDLPADQLKLLEAAKATGKPLIVVNMSGSAINLAWAKQNANAILQAWYPGEAGGLAVGRVIAGLANPAGRLPVTFYRDVSQLPAFDEYSMQGRTYRYFEGEPVYRFGFGLSYTRFAYGSINIKPRGRSTAEGIVVETEVTNTGTRDGDEVAQLYLHFPDAPGVPKLALRGFQRIHLAAGAKRMVRFVLSSRDISSVSPEGKIRVLAGRYRAYVGGGQPGSDLPGKDGNFTVQTSVTLPD
jgi:beta-glucosidase